jgi:hypothetical protein
MKGNYFRERSIPLFFLLLTVVAYGLLLPLTGFYWDDWPFAWIAKFLGSWEFIPAFSKVRPFLGPIFFVTTSLIPPVPLYWQIFALVIRFLSALSAWFALKQIWPFHPRQTLIASLLFLVFPGYSQHWVAFTHINQEWIPFIFYLLSFGFTARALRRSSALRSPGAHPGSEVAPQRHEVEAQITRQSLLFEKDTMIALLLLVAGVFPTEYFVSIEPLRFLFIWVILSEKVAGFRQRFLVSLRRWIPYLLIWLANAAWLAYFYTIGGYESYDVEIVNQPLSIMGLLSMLGEAVWKAGFYIWAQVLILISKAIAAPTSLITLALIAVTFVLVAYYLSRLALLAGETSTFARSALFIGLLGILLGRIPSVAAGLPLTLQSSFDRFMISMMLGGSLFTVGLIELVVRSPRFRLYSFALLIALGVGQQFLNANIFRRDWTKQQEIYWQLAWRVPAMKPNTALLTDQLPIDYETDLSFTAPINWIYAPDYVRDNVPYALLYTEKRLGGGSLPSLQKGVDISLPIRRVSFQGSTSQALVIYMPQNGCLRVLDPARGDEITYGRQSRFLVEAIPLSDLSNILAAGQTPQISFLREPEHTWCYYYARAELAYQEKDFKQVIALIDEATSLGFGPEDPFEWLTYIEAQALAGDMETAEDISKNALRQENGIRRGLCVVWQRVQSTDSKEATRVNQMLAELQCAS